MANVEIYTKDWCGYSARAKVFLDAKGVPYTDIDVTSDTDRELEMRARAGRTSVPQIFLNGRHLGGHDDLMALAQSGELDSLLEESEQRAGYASAA